MSESRAEVCPDCGRELETTVLMTGTYTMCVRCQDRKIEQNMEELRTELRGKGYEI